MKKILPIFFTFLIMLTSVWGQKVMGINLSQPESTHYVRCVSVENHNDLKEHYPNIPSIEEFEYWIEKKIEENKALGQTQRVAYEIPYIVHVIHDGEPIGTGDNISDDKIYSQIKQINDDFQRNNSDVGNTPADFVDVAAGIDLTFVPATIDEDGNVLSSPGIRRIDRSDFGWTAPPYGTCLPNGNLDRSYIEGTIKPSTQFDPTKYFNIWTMDVNCGVLGYAQFPSGSGLPGLAGGASITDGVVLLATSIGSLDNPGATAPYNLGRTATHEIGHWLGLRHIWGDGDCSVDDYCTDTPNAGNANYTGGACSYPGANSCTGGFNDMFQNYMDYSDDRCMNLFTQDQLDRVVAVLDNSPNRNDLLTSTVGQEQTDIITASFSADVTSGCGPLAVSFTDASTAGNDIDPINSWTWNFDVNGLGGVSPSMYNGQNPPTVTFSNAGVYEVQLTASNGTEIGTETLDITVVASSAVDNLNGQDLVVYTITDRWGYLAGHNEYVDRAKVEYFDDLAVGAVLTSADFRFSVAGGNPNSIINFAVWDNSGPGGEPGTKLATATKTISELSTDGLTNVDFDDITISGPVYIGFDQLEYGPNQDTIALYTNSDGETVPGTAWEQWDGGTWYAFSDANAWGANLSLAVYANVGCPVVENNPPTANFQADATQVCEGTEVGFTDLSTDLPTSWQWDFGDGSPISTEQNPTHTFNGSGDFTVTLTATNDEGFDSETMLISVQPFPSSFAANASETTICAGESVDLSMSGTFGATYTWEVDGTVVANGGSTTVSPTETTTYLAICDNGVCRVTDEITITVNPSPETPTISVSGADLTANSTSTGTWQWLENGSPIVGPGATGQTYTAPASGAYSVTITDANGCSSTSAVTNLALDPPVADFSASATTVCVNSEVDFQDLSTNNPTSWSWDFGDGVGTSLEQNPSYTYTAEGDYTVTLTATNIFGSDIEIKTSFITVEVPPTGFEGVATPETVCAGSEVSLSMTGTFGGVYNWYDEDDNLISSGMNATVFPTETATYIATCEDVCLVESEVIVNVNALPDAPTISQDGFTLTATSNTTGGVYQWYLNGSEIDEATSETYSATEDGSYTVTVTDANGCVSLFSSTTIIANTAVIDQMLDESISVYPNPVNKQLTVKITSNNFSELQLSVIDVMGRTLNTLNVNNTSTQINMEQYAAGVYLIRLTNNEGHFAIREVIKK